MKIRKTGIAALFAIAMSACAWAAEAPVVNVYAWDGYLPPAVAEQFSRETGIKVRVAMLDSNGTLQVKLLAGNSGYDLVTPSVSYAGKQVAAGGYRPLDRAKLGNWAHLDPAILKAVDTVDPGQRYTVPYISGTNGLGVNDARVKAALGGTPMPANLLGLVFDPVYASKVSKCGISVLDSPLDLFGMALIYLGKDPFSTKPADIDAATQLLKKARPYIATFNSSEYINGLAGGDYCVAYGWSGDIATAASTAKAAGHGMQLRYWLPPRSVLWVDTLAIPKDAPHPQNALRLINFLLRPDIAAQVSNGTKQMSTNRDARPLIAAALRDSADLNPGPERLRTLSITPAYDANAQRLITRQFQLVKTGR
ncbi:extracellular solute-binding protein [Neisseriaceae bacterium JH1-16]|nr:extracellular solute-binding protein [Neisseriaceae bacterium JH1-16]